jgi:hypothetical protein
MRALAILVVNPFRELGAGVIETEGQGFVEKLVPHRPFEAFTEAFLRRLARCDEVPSDLLAFRPDCS